jgi:hypothetical protein
MMFNTGDLARWFDDGSLEPLGRKDDQVKIQGFRVELDGVSKSMERHPSIAKACALKIGEQLCGFYSAPAKLENHLLEALVGSDQPYYAIPTIWVHLATIRLTANGKVDKQYLRVIAGTLSEEPETPTALAVSPSLSNSGSSSTLSSTQSSDLNSSMTLDATLSGNSDIEKALYIETKKIEVSTLEQEYGLPPKHGYRGWRWVRYIGLSAYRKLFGTIFLANLLAFLLLLWGSRENDFSLPLPHLATAVAANLLGAVLLRQDHVVNFIFWGCSRVPTCVPLSIRKHFARVYHNGGVHSGCAVSATAWWVIFTGAATGNYLRENPHNSIDLSTLVLTFLILSLLLAILVMAYPSIRMKLHDQFEWTHRFAGWMALALVWAHAIVSTASLSTEPLTYALVKTPAIYMIALITLSIALPWMRLRRVRVVPEPLSNHAVRLHFDFCTPGPCTSRGVRITDRPLVEWHAFAAIPEPGGKGFSIIVSKAGDWTKRIIENPPTSIWTRGTPASGVLAIVPLFKKIVLVATGSGIGPCLPVVLERRVPFRMIWSTKSPLSTYGQKIIDTILKADPEAVIWDTDRKGRPNLAVLAYRIYQESGAECVCVISNSSTTKKIMYRLESRGVPAFGPIWDS